MAYPTQDDVLRALAGIEIPGFEKNIVRDGMISALSAKEQNGGLHIQLVLEIDPSQAAQMEEARQQVLKTLQSMDGVSAASVILSAHKAAPSEKAAPKKGQIESKLPQGVKQVIAVASGKGGVGKSTTAVNLALSLARAGLRVGLLDADVYGPSVPQLLGIADHEVELGDDNKLLPIEVHGLGVMSIGLLVDEDAPMIWRGPMVHGAIRQMLYDVNWGQRDILVMDLPPGTGDAPLSVAQQVPLAGAVIVSTPQDIALLDVRKGISMFQKIGVPVLGLIENMSYFECPNCHQRTDIFGHGGAKADAERLNLNFLGQMPLDLQLREMSDAGTPIVVALPEAEQSKLYSAMAQNVLQKLRAPNE